MFFIVEVVHCTDKKNMFKFLEIKWKTSKEAVIVTVTIQVAQY